MKKIKLIALLIAFMFTSVFSPNITHAADPLDCEFSGSDPLYFCMNNFNSQSDIKKLEVKFDCVDNCGSNWLNALRQTIKDFILGDTQTISLENAQIGQHDDGSYYTCLQLHGWDKSVLDTMERCMKPTATDLIAKSPACLGSLSLGVGISYISAGSAAIFVTPIVSAICLKAVPDAQKTYEAAAKACEPKFKAVVQNRNTGKNFCKVNFGLEVLSTEPLPFNACRHITDPYLQEKCTDCMGKEGEGSSGGVWTGLGCLSFSPSGFIRQFLQIAIGLGGGIAFLLLIYGAFLMTTSAGDPKAADNAKQIITGAITGLLVIIFSVVILNIIGVQILQIPGL